MTFEQLKDAITDWLGKDHNQITDTVRGQLVNMAQRRILRNYDLRFGEHTAAQDTANADPDYDVPAGYSRTYSIWYKSGTEYYDLISLTKEEFDKMFGDNSATSNPTHYCIWENQLFLGPCPDATYSLNWQCYRMLPDLADGSPNNENDMTDAVWEYLLFKALALATKYLIEDARGAVWAEEADRLEADIVREHAREKSVHRRPTTNEPG